MIALVVCISLGQSRLGLVSALIENQETRRAVEQVQEALKKDPELYRTYRGFRDFVRDHPDIALAENAFDDLQQLPSVRAREGAFEEALRTDGLLPVFRRFYETLRRYPEVRETIERLDRVEVRETVRDRDIGGAVAYLKGHPSMAVEFLEHSARVLPTPGPLRPLRDRLRKDPALGKDLSEIFVQLDRVPAVHADVYPWWSTAFDEPNETGRAYRALRSSLVRFPERFWTWHRRNLAWAAYPEVIAWRDYWYGLVRRTPALADTYFVYARTVRERPDVEVGLGETPASEGEPWPPASAPPELPPWPTTESILKEPAVPKEPTLARPTRPVVSRPESTGLRRPTPPERPKAPSATVRSNEREPLQ